MTARDLLFISCEHARRPVRTSVAKRLSGAVGCMRRSVRPWASATSRCMRMLVGTSTRADFKSPHWMVLFESSNASRHACTRTNNAHSCDIYTNHACRSLIKKSTRGPSRAAKSAEPRPNAPAPTRPAWGLPVARALPPAMAATARQRPPRGRHRPVRRPMRLAAAAVVVGLHGGGDAAEAVVAPAGHVGRRTASMGGSRRRQAGRRA